MLPNVETILVCDGIHRDPSTGKHTLLGTFTRVNATEFPAQIPQIGIYLVLTGARSIGQVGLRIVRRDADADDGETTILDSPGVELKPDDPFAIYEIGIMLAGLVFPEAGDYRIKVLWNNEPIGNGKRIVVHGIQPQ